jgi:hypothetical protein
MPTTQRVFRYTLIKLSKAITEGLLMKKTSKILIGLFAIEAAFTGFFFYSQPQCEPCLPETPCPPCISETQIIVFWAGILVAAVIIAYFIFIYFRRMKNGL